MDNMKERLQIYLVRFYILQMRKNMASIKRYIIDI